ncbi:DUF1801 domain-containing protein [Ideonella sp. DXS29W]|uniref:DUF1801 domain-containing protein n=1 Tax=Ideonella lacteola TaxID=2984193 RepID=A0ABU9BRM9_9BURK
MRTGPRSKALVSAWLDFQPEAQREVAQALRAAIREAEPGLTEIVRWGQLVFLWDSAPMLAIAPHRGHVNLQIFNGHLLPPGLSLLEGSGRGVRSFKCRLRQPVDVVQVQMLVAASVARAARDDRGPAATEAPPADSPGDDSPID